MPPLSLTMGTRPNLTRLGRFVQTVTTFLVEPQGPESFTSVQIRKGPSKDHRTNRYPTPHTVARCLRMTSSPTLCRRAEMTLSTVRSVPS